MSVAHPFHRSEIAASQTRGSAFTRRRQRPSSTTPPGSGLPGSGLSVDTATAAPARRRPIHDSVVPGTRTPAGVPRDLVVDETGKPRRAVLLAAIMIRRGRSVAEISAATGLPADVVTCLSRSV